MTLTYCAHKVTMTTTTEVYRQIHADEVQGCTGILLSAAAFLATTRYLYVVCVYGAIHLQILFLKHHIFLFCHEILKFFT
jgi:hypothetical protein